MTLSSAATGSSILLAQLLSAAVRTIVLAAGTGLLLSLFRLKAVSVRLFAWTAVLYAGLSMPILGWLLHPVSIAIPFAPLHASAKPLSASRGTLASSEFPSPEPARNLAMTRSARKTVSHDLSSVGLRASWMSTLASIPWTTLTAAAYLAITVFLLFRLIAGCTCARRLVRSSHPVQKSRLLLKLSSRAHVSGSRIVPRVHESRLVSVPITIGVIAPTILLPTNWDEWDEAKLYAVIVHEKSHVVRRDALSQYVSLLYRAIFWFSPLAWWLNRQITELAEEASDEAALAAGAERTCYAKTLLGFYQAVRTSQGRIQWQGVSIANVDQAEKRLEKILAWRGGNLMRFKRLIIVAVFAFAIPAIYLAAAAQPVTPSQSSQDTTSPQGPVSPPNTATPTKPQPPASTPAAPSLPAPPAEGGVSNSGPPPAQPISPAVPAMPAKAAPPAQPISPAVPAMPASAAPPSSPVAPQEEDSARNSQRGFAYAHGFDDEQRFAIVSGDSGASAMSGTSEDARHVQELRKQIPGDFIWFQRDEKSYIIRDQATIDRARQLWAPQEELGRRRAELGEQQEALGKQRQELGVQMQQVRVKLPDMTAELDELKEELQQLGPNVSVEQMGKIQAQIGQLQVKVGELRAHAGDERGKVAAEMRALGEQQGRLGEQLGELSRQQAELAQKAIRGMKELLDEAIKNGIAQLEPGSASL